MQAIQVFIWIYFRRKVHNWKRYFAIHLVMREKFWWTSIKAPHGIVWSLNVSISNSSDRMIFGAATKTTSPTGGNKTWVQYVGRMFLILLFVCWVSVLYWYYSCLMCWVTTWRGIHIHVISLFCHVTQYKLDGEKCYNWNGIISTANEEKNYIILYFFLHTQDEYL